MKITGIIEVESIRDVVCDICRCSTRLDNDSHQFATRKAHWSYGAKHIASATNCIYAKIFSFKIWLI